MNFNQVKLVLRDIEDIIDKEIVELWRLIFKLAPDHVSDARDYVVSHLIDETSAETFAWALSKHFDIFGLIKSELAIDAESLKQKEVE